jgi:hypothetical protein
MPFKLASNDGKTVVLSQSQHAKIALCHTREYSLLNAVNLASLSYLVYNEYETVKEKLSRQSFRNRPTFNPLGTPDARPILLPYLGAKDHATEGIEPLAADSSLVSIINTQAFHFNDDEFNVLAFRGTQEVQDFIADGFAPKHYFLAGEVHKGFHDNFQAIKKQLVDLLAKPGNRKCKTIITGHSLGGALATLAAAYISSNYAADPCGQVMLYTYGSPRVGTVPWVDAFEGKFIHFRHRRVHDPITMLPPHHSSMQMPSLPVQILSGAMGGYGLVVGEAIFHPGESDFAFVHHGQGILLQEAGDKTWAARSDLKREFVVPDGVGWNSKEVLLAREFWMNVKGFSRGMGPHSIAGYFANLFRLLKQAIHAWEQDPRTIVEANRDLSGRQEESLAIWKRERENAAFAMRKPVAAASSTSSPDSRHSLSPENKAGFYDELVQHALSLKMQADGAVLTFSQPDAKARLLRLIAPIAPTPAFEKELRYQATVPVYPPPPPPVGVDVLRHLVVTECARG